MDLSTVKTTDLVKELESRPGVKKISVGLYKDYGLIHKYYTDDKRNIEADTVLVVDHLEDS